MCRTPVAALPIWSAFIHPRTKKVTPRRVCLAPPPATASTCGTSRTSS
jgi:hypothetical protein